MKRNKLTSYFPFAFLLYFYDVIGILVFKIILKTVRITRNTKAIMNSVRPAGGSLSETFTNGKFFGNMKNMIQPYFTVLYLFLFRFFNK